MIIVEQSRSSCATQKPDCLAVPSKNASVAGFGDSTLPAACARTKWNGEKFVSSAPVLGKRRGRAPVLRGGGEEGARVVAWGERRGRPRRWGRRGLTLLQKLLSVTICS
jgi:hypothetical protein